MKIAILYIWTLYVLIPSVDPETASFLDNWFPFGIPESTIKMTLEQDDVQYTRSTVQGSVVIHAIMEYQSYMYFLNEDSVCYMIVKEYPLDQLSKRLKRFENWTLLDVDYLQWSTDSFYYYTVVARMDIEEDVISIMYWTE